MPQVVLWEQDAWRCELWFRAKDTHLRLYDGTLLVFDQIVAAGLDAFQQANAWKTAICQAQKAKPA